MLFVSSLISMLQNSLPSFTIHALLFICSESQADKPILLRLYFSPHPDKEKAKKKTQKGLQTHKDESRETSSTGFQTPSLFLRIDYRCHLMQFQPEFFSCATFSFVFPHRNEKMQVDEILIGTVLIYCALS